MKIKEDILQNILTKIVSYYYQNKRNFFIIVGSIIAVIVIIIVSVSGKPKIHPEVQLRFTQALGLYSIDNLSQAEAQFLELTRLFGNTPLGIKAYFYLGRIYYQTQRFVEAQRAFEKFYAKNKNNPVLSPGALMGIANCYEEMNEFKKAATTYEEVYKKYPKSLFAPKALQSAGRCYIQINNYKKAIEILELALKKYPEYRENSDTKALLFYAKSSLGKTK
ncbi:MAG: tetratricopeptide repeat protein [candidate division WOR-3 bacterium]